MTAFREPEVEIIVDDSPAPGEWTPARGLAKGTIATLIVGAILATGWCLLAWNRPDVTVAYRHDDASVTFIMGAVGGIIVFVFCWILFSVMHRTARMVSGGCTLVVVAIALLLILAKQITVAATPGVDTIDGVMVAGKAWLAPARFITSNVGAWAGIVIGVYVFREGDSIMDIFGAS